MLQENAIYKELYQLSPKRQTHPKRITTSEDDDIVIVPQWIQNYYTV
jgi:hypothetical protein